MTCESCNNKGIVSVTTLVGKNHTWKYETCPTCDPSKLIVNPEHYVRLINSATWAYEWESMGEAIEEDLYNPQVSVEDIEKPIDLFRNMNHIF